MLKNILVILVKALISAGLVWLALSSVDIETAVSRARQVKPSMLLLTAFLLFVQVVLGGLRWYSVGKAINSALSLFVSLRLFYIGMFFNQVLPGGTSGDVVRVYLAYKSGITLRNSLNSVMLERLITVVALLMLVSCTQPFFVLHESDNSFYWGKGMSIAVLSIVILGISFLMILEKLPAISRRSKFFRGLSYLGEDTQKIFLKTRNLGPVMTLGILTHVNFSLCAFSLASGLGLGVTLFECLVLMPPIMLVTTIPLTIGGWGVRENAMIVAFGLVGVSSDASLALSVLLGLVALFTALPGGIVWLLSRERREKIDFSEISKKLKVENIEKV